VREAVQNTSDDPPAGIRAKWRAARGIEMVECFQQTCVRKLNEVGELYVAALSIKVVALGYASRELEVQVEEARPGVRRPLPLEIAPELALLLSFVDAVSGAEIRVI
jgi:hypothetical protein